MNMKKSEIANVYGIIRKLDAKNVESDVRAKMLANTIIGKKAATEIEEADKTVKEGLTEEEKEAMQTIQKAQEKIGKDKNYVLTDEEKKAVEVVNAWKKTYKDAMQKELDTEVDAKFETLSKEELNKLAEGNSLTFDELVLLSEALVA